ncbi:HIT family protein [Desulforhopalus sp. 52FAK]
MDINNNDITDENCLFCRMQSAVNPITECKTAIAIFDQNPVSKNHILIIPRRHVEDYFSLTRMEKYHADKLIHRCKEIISNADSSVTGFNIGINCGESAGQTIFHCHIHLIPRRDGDTPAPRGGVRGVIPDKMNYPVAE